MKRTVPFITLLLSLSCLFLLTVGCDKKSDDDSSTPVTYRVRYSAYTEPGDTLRLSYRQAEGKTERVEKKCPDGLFTTTVGPVDAGFEALIIVSQQVGKEAGAISIETSENFGPFEMKAHSDHSISLSYTVGE